jgi:hypothetical protein
MFHAPSLVAVEVAPKGMAVMSESSTQSVGVLNSLWGKGDSMRRWRFSLLLVIPCLSGCTLAIGDDDECGRPWVFGITARQQKAEPVAYCEAVR